MRILSLRLIVALVLGVTLASLISSWYQVQAEKDALRLDLQRKAETFSESLAGISEYHLQSGDVAGLSKIIQRFGNHDHLAGIGVYDSTFFPLIQTSGLRSLIDSAPPAFSTALRQNSPQSVNVRLHLRRLYLFVVPLHAVNGSVAGGLIVAYDTGYIRTIIFHVWSRAFVHIAGQVLIIVAITLLIVRWSLAGPIAKTAQWLKVLRTGRRSNQPPLKDLDFLQPLAQEVLPLAESARRARAAAEVEARLRNSRESIWTADRLADHVRTKLQGNGLFVVSNREPYIHNRHNGSISVTVPASGLVTALDPVLCACNGTWIAQGSGTADRETVDAHDCLQVPPDEHKYTLRRVWITEEEADGFYYGFANEGLWPLCHMAHVRPFFRVSDWDFYNKINARFADALAEEVSAESSPVILIQDYHFALLPRMIKERVPHAKVAIFWHIPWPNPEAFSICPWQQDLLDGLLGADLIGFHIQAHCNNFMSTVDRVLEARVDWDHFSVKRTDHWSAVRPFPISVDLVQGEFERGGDSATAERERLLAELGFDGYLLGVGVDRLDYTKGIIERFLAVESFLERHPRYQGKFSFVQIGAPSRSRIPQYAEFQKAVEREADRINTRFGRWTQAPIVLRNRHHSREELQRYYRAAHLCMVTSLHDGMNLVSKEFVAARQDEHGVLILSRFTGAARDLRDALLVNPYNTEGTADAIARSLEMNATEAQDRMRRMRKATAERNIYWWAASLIGDLCDMRLDRS
jgi:trehalose-6-phosphate synthase